MENQVTVTRKQGESLLTISENPEYGYFRVEQVRRIHENGFYVPKKISALVHCKVSDFEKAPYNEGDIIPGKIIILESLTPFNKKNPENNYKIAGKTGIICKVNGQPIYKNTMFTNDDSKEDKLVKHTNSDEIKRALSNASKSEEKL